jgi:hypothetical protein
VSQEAGAVTVKANDVRHEPLTVHEYVPAARLELSCTTLGPLV